MKGSRVSCTFLILVLLLSALGASGQAPVGQILGTVKDPSGLAIPGAAVVVTNLATGQTFNLKTDSSGDYLVRALPPGEYSVEASFTGFRPLLRTPVTLVAFQNARVDLALELGATTATVTVSAEAPQVDTRSNTLGALVGQRQLTEMPINSNNIIYTINYTPGVQNVSAGNNVNRNQQRINIAGNRSYSTNTQLDGAAQYFAHRGQGIEMPAPDAIQEVKVVTSGVSAEFGRGTAVFMAVTKSGGNAFHGTAWEFIRNEAFDSSPYAFGATNVRKPLLRSHDFGATFGGPILKNKLFFFAEYQGLRLRQMQQTTTPLTPTDAERRGDFSALLKASKPIQLYRPGSCVPGPCVPYVGNLIPTSSFDLVSAKLLAMIPSPNTPNGALVFSGPNPTDGDGGVGKLDYIASSKDQLSFRWFSDYRRSNLPFPSSPAQSIPSYSPTPNSQFPKTFTVSHQRVWTPTLLSTTRFSYTRWIFDESADVHTTLADLGATNFIDPYIVKRLPTITVTSRFSAATTVVDTRKGRDYGLAHDWDWAHGSHQIKVGALIERISYGKPNSSASAGTFTFDGSSTAQYDKSGKQLASGDPVADFLLGSAQRLQQNSGSNASGRYYPMGFYGQDTWKVRPRLTLTLGLRWEIYTQWQEARGQVVTFMPGVQSTTFPAAPAGWVYQTDPQYPYHTNWKNFGPRVGFAWDAFGDGKTSIRGGYGISYDPLVAEPQIHGSQPFSYSTDNKFDPKNPSKTFIPLSNPYANFGGNPFPYTPGPSGFKSGPQNGPEGLWGDFRPMYNQNVSLTIERQLSNTWAMSSSYVGNQSRHGYSAIQLNPTAPGNGTRVYPLFKTIEGYASNLNSSYNSWQTVLTKRVSHGLSFQGHYTWSRVIDQCSTEVVGSCSLQNPYNPAAERGPGDFDRTHVAVMTYIYELPKLASLPHFLGQVIGGWQIASFHVFQSGQPFTVLSGTGDSGTGSGINNLDKYDRPKQVGDPFSGTCANGAAVGTMNCYFNTSAFVANSAGTFGNTARNSLRAPSDVRWDMSIKKIFYPHGERYRLEFRGDVNNIMNHTVFGAPGATVGGKGFGVISSTTTSGRVMRLGLHLDF